MPTHNLTSPPSPSPTAFLLSFEQTSGTHTPRGWPSPSLSHRPPPAMPGLAPISSPHHPSSNTLHGAGSQLGFGFQLLIRLPPETHPDPPAIKVRNSPFMLSRSPAPALPSQPRAVLSLPGRAGPASFSIAFPVPTMGLEHRGAQLNRSRAN